MNAGNDNVQCSALPRGRRPKEINCCLVLSLFQCMFFNPGKFGPEVPVQVSSEPNRAGQGTRDVTCADDSAVTFPCVWPAFGRCDSRLDMWQRFPRGDNFS